MDPQAKTELGTVLRGRESRFVLVPASDPTHDAKVRRLGEVIDGNGFLQVTRW